MRKILFSFLSVYSKEGAVLYQAWGLRFQFSYTSFHTDNKDKNQFDLEITNVNLYVVFFLSHFKGWLVYVGKQ